MGNKLLKNAEWSILIVSIILFIIGSIALFSATQTTNLDEFRKQITWFLISIPFFILAMIIDYNFLSRFSPIVFLMCLGLLVGVLFTKPIGGASSWYKIGKNFTFQPSELTKIVTIIFMAFILNKLQVKGRKEINKPWKLFIYFIFWAMPIALIIKEPDFGTSLAFLFACLFMLYVSGLDKKYIIVAILIIAIAAVPVYERLPEHAKTRIDSFIHQGEDIRGSGYNMYQSKLAIGAGQMLGMGLLKGNQTQLGFLHPKTTDFIFAVIGEELGFVITSIIVILYIILITKSVYVAKTAKDNIGSYIAIGISGMLFFYMIQNIGMTIGLLPITGVPLPFVSYGGSSLVTNFICIGLLLNISSRRQKAIFME